MNNIETVRLVLPIESRPSYIGPSTLSWSVPPPDVVAVTRMGTITVDWIRAADVNTTSKALYINATGDT